MIKKTILYVVLALMVITGVDLWRGKDLPVGKLPQQQWQSLQYEAIDVVERSYETPVIVYFWGTWCPVCSVITPSVDWLAGYLPVVSVAMSSGSDAELRRYLVSNDYRLVVVNDPQAVLSQQWGVPVTPAFAVVRNGEVQSFTAGPTTPLGLYARWLWAHW